MVKQPFVVGFWVEELPEMEKVPRGSEGGVLVPEEAYALSSPSPGLDVKRSWEIQSLENEPLRRNDIFTADQRSNAINIPRTLAMAYVMDQARRSCNVSDVLTDLVDAVRPVAHKQQGMVELSELSLSLQVAIEEPALRQALSNLIEGALLGTHVGGKVEIISTSAPAGGALLVIDDDGPDMHHMMRMHSLTPFGAELFSENMIEDNMTWNFVAGLTGAREILESYGCVVRIISPRSHDAALGAGGTRVELWLPSFAALSGTNNLTKEA